eukprot:1266328-Rhodomonas_salina.4
MPDTVTTQEQSRVPDLRATTTIKPDSDQNPTLCSLSLHAKQCILSYGLNPMAAEQAAMRKISHEGFGSRRTWRPTIRHGVG